MSSKMKEAFDPIPYGWFEKSESDLIYEAFHAKTPPEEYQKIKINLWREYYRVRDVLGKEMSMKAILAGVCAPHYFYNVIAKNFARMAYLISEPIEYLSQVEDILTLATPEMRRIMQLPDQVNPKTGCINTDLLALKFKIWQHVEARTHGAIEQNFKHDVNQKNLNLNADITPGTDVNQFNTLEEIQAKIKELEKPRVVNLPPARDVLPTDYISVKTNRGPNIEVLHSEELLNHGRPIKGGS